MTKKLYTKPEVLNHASIAFETGLSSCIDVATRTNPPYNQVCLRPDGTWVDL